MLQKVLLFSWLDRIIPCNSAHSVPLMLVLGFRCRFYLFQLFILFLAYLGLICSSSIQRSPKGEVDSGEYIPKREESGYII